MRWMAVLVIGLLAASCDEDGGSSASAFGPAGHIGSAGGGPSADPSCQRLSSAASQAVAAAVQQADRSCSSAADCMAISIDSNCHASCGALVSADGVETVLAEIQEQNATTCVDFVADGCGLIVPPCAPPLPTGCVRGTCMELSVDPGTVMTQDAGRPADGGADADEDGGVPDVGDGDGDGSDPSVGCIDRTLRFGSDGGFVAFVERFALAPCNGFSIERTSFGDPGSDASCENRVAADATVSALDVAQALDHPDVRAALDAAPVLFGRDTRPVDGTVFRVEVDGDVIELGWECMGTPGCTAIPAGLARLESMLQDLIVQQRAVAPCDAI